MDSSVAPVFTASPQLSRCTGQVEIGCQVQAFPAPDYTWWHKNEEVRHSSRLQITSEPIGDSCFALRLIINQVSKTDAGLYRLMARNHAGEVAASINLTVDGEW
jgi:hypothetical protein